MSATEAGSGDNKGKNKKENGMLVDQNMHWWQMIDPWLRIAIFTPRTVYPEKSTTIKKTEKQVWVKLSSTQNSQFHQQFILFRMQSLGTQERPKATGSSLTQNSHFYPRLVLSRKKHSHKANTVRFLFYSEELFLLQVSPPLKYQSH